MENVEKKKLFFSMAIKINQAVTMADDTTTAIGEAKSENTGDDHDHTFTEDNGFFLMDN